MLLGGSLLLVGWHRPGTPVRPAVPSPTVALSQPVAPAHHPERDYLSGKRGATATSKNIVYSSKPIPVAVLMYHEIRKGPNSLYLPAPELADHLEALRQAGYVGITPEQLYQAYSGGAKLPLHPVVLTFDDGYASFYTNAFPLLQRYGYPGTLFVITGNVGKPEYVTWDQVREMAAAGIEMGGHTVNHPDLSKLDSNRQAFELTESRRVLAEQSGRPVRFFAYPSGRYTDRTLALTKQAGYVGAVTTLPGLAEPGQDVLQWHRIRVNPGISGTALVVRIRSLETAAAPSH
ncbi:MAG: polysaccharide deacetylase [Firmicutes bacterium]|nr:polysaccharide deacetylase [Bacillota bacterium]